MKQEKRLDLIKIKTIMKLHQEHKSIQIAIKLLILVVFMGYIVIWIMMPTNTFWLHWLPAINAKANSTYFGELGTNFLIYCLPILLIATLGCMYLHLDKYSDDSNSRTSKLNSWRQPMLVKGPLGIVSWIELSFVLMFVALLVWSFSAYIHAMFNNITKQSSSQMGEQVWEVKLDSVALLLGLVGNVCLSFLFFPVTRASSILRLFGLTSESSVKYHIWLGHSVLTIFVAHGLCYAIFWASTHQISEMMKWDSVGISNVAGEVALLSGLMMWVTSSGVIRRKHFELFFYTHHMYIIFIVFFVLHVGFSYSCIMLPGFYLFLIDRFLRFLQSQQNVRLLSARVLPCCAMELNFSKHQSLSYNASSIIFINVKSISKLQWHPFTVTSNSNMDLDQLSIVIKSEGNWSQKLYEKLSSPTPSDHLEVSVEGPYSSPSSSFIRHDVLVLVSGGSGITPFVSIIRELMVISNTNAKPPRVILIAAFKKSEDLTMLDFLVPFSGFSTQISHLQLHIQAYITSPSLESQKQPKIICFKPSDSNKPISLVLGPNNWLWLGAIISSSFTIFLLLIALLNRYYIYTIDHDASRSMINALLLCASIAIVATLAFIRTKKQDKRQIESVNTPERELESMPISHQWFEQVTQVHYGERPDFNKLVSEFEGLNVSVLVSGPEKMKQDVAAICLDKGLHYQSFSFQW